ncbi:cytidine deaminase [Klebsiella sp. BIGb0407]|uniref:cytidine deaminase n=1 Tax=Klebsiella sp. BIGb0407 TaxID=2940603 RepID=UPI00216823B1|nr:cytidine deaminase [Klebsiella sp. BIGb0407]MCS3431581.1 cytidine deaminase [Klebsiella sp. BIGb0407]
MRSRFDSAFTQLSASLQTVLQPLLVDEHFPAMFTAAEVAHIKQHTNLNDNELAFALLPLAAACARPEISKFYVGAVARGVSGNLYFGGNMEFIGSTMQQTVHAEQSAITHAWMRGEKALESITVNYTPCGHCRQFMNELNSGTQLHIHLPGVPPATLGDYLPHSFGPRDLDIKTLLLDDEDHHLTVAGDEVTQAAIVAANRSHAPYSQAPSGIALETIDGNIFVGSYAENAAFNPSLPPLQAALNILSLSGYEYTDITRAVLVERRDASLVQWPAVSTTLNAIGVTNISQTLVD